MKIKVNKLELIEICKKISIYINRTSSVFICKSGYSKIWDDSLVFSFVIKKCDEEDVVYSIAIFDEAINCTYQARRFDIVSLINEFPILNIIISFINFSLIRFNILNTNI